MTRRYVLVGLIVMWVLGVGAIILSNAVSFPLETKPDLELMWETYSMRSSDPSLGISPHASTDHAIKAADRVFAQNNLVGLTRQEVIDRIGDPHAESNSVYNFPFYPPNSTAVLVYRFDNGAWGSQYNVVFDSSGKVVRVDWLPIE